MRILFLSNKLPHADVAGGQRLVYDRINHMVNAGHQVGLATFIANETEIQIDSIRPLLDEICCLKIGYRSFFKRAFHDYLSWNRPALFWKNYSLDMMRAVGRMVDRGRYDVVIAEFSEMGQYLHQNPYLSAVKKIISCHQCLTMSFEQYAKTTDVRRFLKYKSCSQVQRLQKYEFDMYHSADRIFVLTPQDRFTLQYYAPELAVSVVPAGVDIAFLEDTYLVPKEQIVLMTGFMGDPANDDGAEWFCRHVWPQLKEKYPGVRFYIVGASPRKRLRHLLRKEDRIVITGEVDDLRSYRARARVFVSPVRLGSGLRTKVLQAMASGVPVVSTSLGVAGIEARTGVNCLIADTPELFLQSIEWLLSDRTLSARIVQQGRELVKRTHSLENDLVRFEKTVKSVVEG